jgi:hypothetical protein
MKHPAARIINIVVGRPGMIIPIIPSPLRTSPKENQNILRTGKYPLLRVFFSLINLRPIENYI